MFPVTWSSGDQESKGEQVARENLRMQAKAAAKARKKDGKAATGRRTSSQSSTSNSSNVENAKQPMMKSSISSFAQNIGTKLSTTNPKGSAKARDSHALASASRGPDIEVPMNSFASTRQGKVVHPTTGSQLRDSTGSSQLGASGSETFDSSRPSSQEGYDISRYTMLPLQLPPRELTSPGNREVFLEPLTGRSSVSSGIRESRNPLEYPKLLKVVNSQTPGEPNQAQSIVTGQLNGKSKTLMMVKQVTEVSYSPRPQLVRDEHGDAIGLGFEPVSSRISPVPTIQEEDEDEILPPRPTPISDANTSEDSSESCDSRPVSPIPRPPLSLGKWRQGPNTTSKLKQAPPVLSQDKWDPPENWDCVPRTPRKTKRPVVQQSQQINSTQKVQLRETQAMATNNILPLIHSPGQRAQIQAVSQKSNLFQNIMSVQQLQPPAEFPSWSLGNGGTTVVRGETSLQRIIRQMDTSSVRVVLTALAAPPDPGADGEDYRKMELERQLWLHRGMDLLVFLSGHAHKVDRRGISATSSDGFSKVLSLHESHGEVAILTTFTTAEKTHHFSTSPVDSKRFKQGTLVPFTAQCTSQTEFGYAANVFSMVQSLPLPTLARSHEIPDILRQCHRILLPQGKLCLTIIDAVPTFETTGPLLQEWLEDHLLVHLELKSRATHPSRTIKHWLKQSGFVFNPTDGIHLVFPATVDLESISTPDMAALSTEIGRRLWQEVWGSYVAAEQWWWDDSAILKECAVKKTRWVCHIIDCAKQPGTKAHSIGLQ